MCLFFLLYILEMQKPITTIMPKDADDQAKAKVTAENGDRTKMMSEEKFKNIFKFVQLMFEAACNNPDLFLGKISFIKLYFVVDLIFIFFQNWRRKKKKIVENMCTLQTWTEVQSIQSIRENRSSDADVCGFCLYL